MVDTFPVQVLQPLDSLFARQLYQPKYGCCVYKFQLGCSFLGHFITFSGLIQLFVPEDVGPHLGISYDGDIWDSTLQDHPLNPEEWMLGDGHYISQEGFIAPFRHPPHSLLPDDEYYFNAVLSRYRARVEHSNRRVKSHALFHTPWRGSVGLLSTCVRITVHTQAIVQKMYLMYPPCGPWPHY